MTALDAIDAEIVSTLDRPDAERLDKRIRLLLTAIEDNRAKLYGLVEQAKAGGIHAALGFPSWTAYVADVFTVQVRLDRSQRQELVGWLSGEGMPQRAIADVVGVDQKTVSNDLRAREENSSPEPADDVDEVIQLGLVDDAEEYRDISAMADVSEEAFEEVLADARGDDDLSRENVAQKCRERTAITGRDGKRYPKPKPQKPRRRPITDTYRRAVYDMDKVLERLARLTGDDRFERNRGELCTVNLASLIRICNRLDDEVINRLSGNLARTTGKPLP